MTKNKKLIAIIVSCVLAVALITLAIVLIVANSNREKTETSIMTCSVNPQVQFVLNGNDKVMKVVALNNAGQEIAVNGDFVGLKADEAAELFVTLSTNSGYIDVETTGTTVEINLTGLKDDYTKLKEKVVNKVNSYFDEKGIIAGALAEIDKDIKDAIYTLKSTATNMENKTDKELIEHYMAIVDLLHNEEGKMIKASAIPAFFAAYDSAVATYQTEKAKIEATIEDIQAQIAGAGAVGTDVVTQLQTQLNYLTNTALPKLIEDYNRAISNQYNINITTDDIIAQFETDFNNKVNNVQDKIDSHVTNYQNNKADIEQKITDYRNSLVAE